MTYTIQVLQPSMTLAWFLAQYTKLPFDIWYIILKKKYDLEVNNFIFLDEFKYKRLSSRLRSNRIWKVETTEDNSLENKMIKDSYKILSVFMTVKDVKRTIKSSKFYHKKVYYALLEFMYFFMEWCHYMLNNKDTKEKVKDLYNAVGIALKNICIDVKKIKGNSEYKDWFLDVRHDLLYFNDYLTCPCCWYEGCKKCDICKDFEQYMYNYDYYYENYTILRNGKRIVKNNAFTRPIIIHNVYKIN